MPAFVVPARSGAHRVAAIALYRALLTQCSPAASPSLPLADDQRAALRNVIRNKFRRNRHVHSARHLKLSFTAGYELLDALDRASPPNTTTTTTTTSATASTPTSAATGFSALLSHLLATAPPHLTRSPTAPTTTTKPPTPRRLHPSPEACPPPASRVLATRPLPAAALGGTGVRRVPRLVSANLFPMLRLRKPQPRSLSRVLTDRIKQRQRRIDVRKEAAGEWVGLGREEDVWDRLVGLEAEEEGGGGGGGGGRKWGDWEDVDDGGDSSWAEEPERLVRIISAQLGAQKRETVRMVERMQEIVDRETALAKAEREARRKRREVARMGGKRMKEVEAISGGRAERGRAARVRRPPWKPL